MMMLAFAVVNVSAVAVVNDATVAKYCKKNKIFR